MLSKSFQDGDSKLVGFANYAVYFETPALAHSLGNSIQVALVATVIALLAGFLYAYALTRTCMPFKRFFRLVAFVPLLTPSLLGGISLVYWFGKQGVARGLLMGEEIYGPIGIVLGSCYWVFPHAVIILIAALSITDGRLYEAAESLKAGKLRAFLTVTLPGSKYGVISAGFVIFTLVFTDFGVPKVIGRNYDVLATDIYKQVVGQQNFENVHRRGSVRRISQRLIRASDGRRQRGHRPRRRSAARRAGACAPTTQARPATSPRGPPAARRAAPGCLPLAGWRRRARRRGRRHARACR